MDIKVVDQMGEEAKPLESKESEKVPVVSGDLMVQSIGQLFDLRPNEIESSREKIELLLEYAKSQTEDRSPEALKWAIRSLQGKVGTPPLGQGWIPYLSQYAYLKLESLKMQKEVERYEHN